MKRNHNRKIRAHKNWTALISMIDNFIKLSRAPEFKNLSKDIIFKY